MMLVLSRRKGQRLLIGDDVVVTVLDVGHGRVRVGIEAPRDLPVLRAELRERLSTHSLVVLDEIDVDDSVREALTKGHLTPLLTTKEVRDGVASHATDT